MANQTDGKANTSHDLPEITHRLSERVKELNCLYGISRLVEDGNYSIAKILQDVVAIIPPSWQYPEITCARIKHRDQVYCSSNFQETPWRQMDRVKVKGKFVGTVEVYYLESRPECDEGPFLKEERALIHAVAERLGHVIDRKEADEKLVRLYEKEKELRQKLQVEVENRIAYTRSLVHELKTPLTALVATSQLLTDEITEPEVHKLATYVVENAIRIDNRINELHDVIKGEVGILKLKPQSLDLWRLLGEIVDEAAALAKQYRVEVRLGKLEDIPLVYADADRVRQVITNLLNNAFEYASQGGRVDINVSRHRSAVAFEMRDYGPGIAETKLSRLSSRQTRNTATGEHPGGLGIGLTLCKMLVELHGGKFWVKNRPGKGTSVCFTLTEYKVQANESAKG